MRITQIPKNVRRSTISSADLIRRKRFALPWICRCLILLILFCGNLAFGGGLLELQPKLKEGYEIKDNKIYFRRGDIGLILESVNEKTIAKYYSDRGIELGNPFVFTTTDSQNSVIFLLTLLNRTHGTLTFTPAYVSARVKNEAYFPMDFTVLLAMIDGLNKGTQKVLQSSVFHSPESVTENEVTSKFLIFPAIPKKVEELKLEFDYLYFGNNEIKTNFYFEQKKSPAN